jgi:hypothetical protein
MFILSVCRFGLPDLPIMYILQPCNTVQPKPCDKITVCSGDHLCDTTAYARSVSQRSAPWLDHCTCRYYFGKTTYFSHFVSQPGTKSSPKPVDDAGCCRKIPERRHVAVDRQYREVQLICKNSNGPRDCDGDNNADRDQPRRMPISSGVLSSNWRESCLIVLRCKVPALVSCTRAASR